MARLDGHPAPANSLEAVKASLQAGAAFIEIDVNALAEGDYLLVHDDLLESETSGQGAVIDSTPAQIRRLFIKVDGAVTRYPAALLSDVVDQFKGYPRAHLQLDFKNVRPLPTDEPLERLLRLVEPLGQRVIVSSGADWQLRRLRKLAPRLLLGFDVMWNIAWQPAGEERDPRDFPRRMGAYGYYDDSILATEKHWPTADYLRDRCESVLGLVPEPSVFYLEHNLIAQSLRDGFNWAELLHAHGIRLDAWTMDVTDPVAVENVPALLASGVDLFTSNTPQAMARLLDQARPSK